LGSAARRKYLLSVWPIDELMKLYVTDVRRIGWSSIL